MRLASVVGTLALVAMFGTLSPALSLSRIRAETPPTISPAELLQNVVDAMNRGDRDAWLGFLSDDAVVEGFPDCSVPCVGSKAIRAEFTAIIAAHVYITTSDVQVSGDTVTSHFVATSDILDQLQIERVLGTFTLQVQGGKITSATFVLDPNDPQTARIIALGEGTSRLQPNAPSRVLPYAGSAAYGAQAFDWTALAAVLSAFGVLSLASGLSVCAAVRRRRE